MQGKIAVEEHFALEETVDGTGGPWTPSDWSELRGRLLDIHDRRLREMDAGGVELMLLSLTGPAVQAAADPDVAADLAMRANDYLAEQIARRPERFLGLAALPMQDPERAARELERCIRTLGFRGALVNGFSQIGDGEQTVYYDLPAYRSFWAELERLHVPFYLHPRNPLPKDAAIYGGHPWLFGPAWAFGQEIAVHALRLMGSGLFDAHPALKVILGHMGEGLPYSLWRIDNHNRWTEVQNKYPAKRKIAEYFQENFYVTTSGNFSTRTLIDAMLELGSDRILFSVDWPFEEVTQAAAWFDTAPISEADRRKIGADNARALFGLTKAGA